MITINTSSKAGSSNNQDRVAFFEDDQGIVLVVADGAGGIAGGDAAADMALNFVKVARHKHPLTTALCSRFIANLDSALHADAATGECTIVIVVIREGLVFGASVGDSEAWLVSGGKITDLTMEQYRKPLVGSMLATPVEFGPIPFVGTLVVGTDGLFNYARRAQIIESVGSIENNALLAEFLTESARLPGGGFSDDTTVAVCSTELVVSEHENLKILLVENHAVFADMVIQEFLGRHQIILVATIYEARRALRETLFDVLLVDYDLDDGKGVEVVLEATRLVTRLTIIAISAHSAGNEALLEAGAFAVCRKSQFHRITEVIDSTFTKPPTIELGTLPPVY